MPNSLLGEEVNGEVDAHLLRIGIRDLYIKGPVLTVESREKCLVESPLSYPSANSFPSSDVSGMQK